MKNLLLCFLLISISLLSPAFVSAHTARTESLMDGEMHINSEDIAIAGEESTLFFKLKDKTGKFAPENCECMVNIFKDDRLIFTQMISPVTDPVSEIDEDYSLVYSFLTQGQYYIHLTGEPKSQDDFDAFRLEFDTLIDRGVIITATPVNVLSEKPVMTSSRTENRSVAVGAILVFVLTGFFVFIKSRLSKD